MLGDIKAQENLRFKESQAPSKFIKNKKITN